MDRADEVIGPIIVLLTYLSVLAVMMLVSRRTHRNRAAVARGDGLYAIAPTLEGEVTRDPSFEGPFIRHTTHGVPTYCHQWMLFDSKPDIVTTFECRVRFRAFLEATSVRALRYPSRSPRFREIAPVESFRIVTTDVDWASEILDSGLRQILHDLGGWRRRTRIQLAIDRFLLEVESALSPSEAAFAAQLVARVAALGGATDLSVGVKFIGAVDVDSRGQCPVCGQALAVAGVHCAQCKVPHHSDCWAYWGRCAIFGCRGRRIALPTSASP